ncbi:hypothetical protein [Methanocella arvoryzae]|nr:hypothetical protein [Methanocella arvoryzae]
MTLAPICIVVTPASMHDTTNYCP